MNQKNGSFLVALCFLALPVAAQNQAETAPTIRICDESGCSERPRNSSTLETRAADPAEARKQAELVALAEKDAGAAYDLGLRYFRGDGVRQDSYKALQWMRDAAERGYRPAQKAVGRFYLMGLEEMGSDPAEAERWLSMAAGSGDEEAGKLLAEARRAKQDEVAYRRWVDAQYDTWRAYWQSSYEYAWRWDDGRWRSNRRGAYRY